MRGDPAPGEGDEVGPVEREGDFQLDADRAVFVVVEFCGESTAAGEGGVGDGDLAQGLDERWAFEADVFGGGGASRGKTLQVATDKATELVEADFLADVVEKQDAE